MTENPIVPLPTGPPQPQSLEHSTPILADGADNSSGIIRCICQVPEDDGFTVQCDKCEAWQHMACMQLTKENLPPKYFCYICSPRPLDARRARELQTKGRRIEEIEQQPQQQQGPKTKKKRSNTTSHKKRESPMASTNGITPAKPTQGPEKVVKATSPKEQQPQPSRKRQRAAQTHLQPPSNGVHQSGATSSANAASPGGAYLSDRNGDGESDTEVEKYRREFNDITADRDRPTSHEITTFLGNLLADGISAPNERHFPKHEFMATLPKIAVKPIPEMSRYYSEHSRWCLSLETPCPKGSPVGLFKGEIGFQKAYMCDPINQYSILHHPKPFVIFHPTLPIYIDARWWGSESRFVRRSCRPNLTLATAILKDSSNSEICFCLFAAEPLKSGTELTLGWDWNGQIPNVAEEGLNIEKMSSEEMRQAAAWADVLAEKMGNCACAGGDECLLNQMKKAGALDSASSKPHTNGTGRKPRVKRKPSTEPTGSRKSSPGRSSVNPTEDDGEGTRAGSAKPRSRDLTPGSVPDIAVENGEMTGREARKFKDVLSRIEKQRQEEQQPQLMKRRKRNSTVSSQMGPSSELIKGSDGKKYKSASTQKDSTSLSSVHEPRRNSHSSTSSDDRKHRRKVSGSSKGQQAANKAADKDKTSHSLTLVPTYVDAAMQTEGDESNLPWWQQPKDPTPKKSPHVPLRKRLLQSLQRDREEAASAALISMDKKRKHDAIDEGLEDLPQKTRKLSDDVTGNKSSSDNSVRDDTEPGDAPLLSLSLKNDGQLPDASTPKTPQSPRPSGPALSDIFSDSDAREKARGTNGSTQSHVNGIRPAGLHLQLPSPSVFQNGPVTPQPQGLPTPNSGPLQSPLSLPSSIPSFSPSTVASVGGNAVNPSPTRTKKLSLQDYGKRKKSTSAPEHDERCNSKPVADVTSVPPETKPGQQGGVLEQPRKFAEIFVPSLAPPTSEPRLTPEATRIPTAPKEQRATNSWGV